MISKYIFKREIISNKYIFRREIIRGVSDVGFSIFADTDADFAF